MCHMRFTLVCQGEDWFAMAKVTKGKVQKAGAAALAGDADRAMLEILQAISSNRSDTQPVFKAIMQRACELCDAPSAGLLVGSPESKYLSFAASLGADSGFVEALKSAVIPMDRDAGYAARAVLDGSIYHFEDMGESDLYKQGAEFVRSNVDKLGIRSVIFVPLMGQKGALGAIALFRNEINPFQPAQISLIESFAAQAAIAIENVHQFRELQIQLEREAAMREILQVISQSRDDEIPVFNAILKSASKLCNAPLGFLSVASEDRTSVTIPAHLGVRPDFGKILDGYNEPLVGSPLVANRLISEGEVILSDEIGKDPRYPAKHARRSQMVDVEGVKSLLAVPLISGKQAIGGILLYRRDVDPFSQDDVALVKSFAAQAVIAIENVRQFRKLESRLEREAATAEILQVISQSRDDEQPVFDEILKNASRLCDAPLAVLGLISEDRKKFNIAAHRGTKSEFVNDLNKNPPDLDPERYAAAKAMVEMRTIHVEDLGDPNLYGAGDDFRVKTVELEGIRTAFVVPLILGDQSIGAIFLYRREVSPFSEEDMALVEAFAAQAVIAIENVRQFKALEARTEEVQALNASLEQRVEDQVGEIERMGKLKRFLPAAVADTVVSQGSDKMLSSHRALLGVLFCDIRGFTAFCETAEPEETIEVLQTYHQEMGKLINAHNAGVDHRMGDGIMVLFNDPVPCEDPAGDAVRLAIAMQERMEELSKQWKRLGHRLGFGVGISMGYATVGMVGYEGRYDYTASGTAINLAARLCDRAENGEILLSTRACIAVEDDFETEFAGEFDLKGIREPVEVFRLK